MLLLVAASSNTPIRPRAFQVGHSTTGVPRVVALNLIEGTAAGTVRDGAVPGTEDCPEGLP
eukprot:7882674-Ditylum_brightwellii.AAC.1